MDPAIAAGQQDSLIEQLSFSLPAVATYARERRLVQVMPAGANTFAPNGNQVMTFTMSRVRTAGWIPPVFGCTFASSTPRPLQAPISRRLAAVTDLEN